MTGFPSHPFWDFSLELYGRPGVAPACLGLQERLGIDVNLLLFCCWAAESGHGQLSAVELAGALEVAQSWSRAVVLPLRGVRQWLKPRLEAGLPAGAPAAAVGALRRDVKASELAAEHAEQLMLAAILPAATGAAPDFAAARANIEAYLKALDVASGPADDADLAAILAALAERRRPPNPPA